MKESTAYMYGFVFGIILVFIVYKIKKLYGKDCKYDERQEIIRGGAYRFSFYVLLILNCAYMLADAYLERLPFSAAMYMMFELVLTSVVHAWYCILKGAYFPINGKISYTIICLLLIGFSNVVVGIVGIVRGEWIENGMLTFDCINMLLGIILLVTVAIILYRINHEDEEDSNEESET